jgi:hypothetical protein
MHVQRVDTQVIRCEVNTGEDLGQRQVLAIPIQHHFLLYPRSELCGLGGKDL